MGELTRSKADLDRIAQAVYPDKAERFTYSVDFVIEEIKKLRRENAELLEKLDFAKLAIQASKGITKCVETQLEAAKLREAEWLKQNGPGGWIDDLRKERDAALNTIQHARNLVNRLLFLADRQSLQETLLEVLTIKPAALAERDQLTKP